MYIINLLLNVEIKIHKYFINFKTFVFVTAHPNVKLFITHCGLMSTQEAIYHGIPIISMPFFMDQHSLTRKLSKKGVAVPLSYGSLSENLLQQAIEEILTNNRYKNYFYIFMKLNKLY